MRIILFLLLCSLPLCALTLQEKIKLAQQAADASVHGKNKSVKKQSPKKSENKSSVSTKILATPKVKYVVNDNDFIADRYVGKIGQSSAERDEIKASVDKAEKMAKSKKDYVIAETKMFVIVSKDTNALSDVKMLVGACERVLQNYFGSLPSKAFTSKNTVKIFPKNTEMQNIVITSEGVDVVVNFKWDKSLSIDDASWALVRSVFEKLANIDNAKCSFPEWIKSAFQGLVAEEIQLGIPTYFSRLASDNPHKNVASILKYPQGESNSNLRKAHAYWLFKSLGKLSERYNLFVFVRNVIEGRIAEAEILTEIEKIINKPDSVKVDLWLGCVMSAEMYARVGGVASPKTSESEILRLCSVRAFSGVEPISVSCDNLFRYSECALEPAKARLNEIKMLLVKINPLFFNSCVLLGEVYEAFLNEDKQKYKESLKEFLLEFTRARNTAKDVEKALK